MKRLPKLLLIVTLTHPVCKAQTKALTVEDCINLAVRAPSTVTLAHQDVEIARYGVAAAHSAFLPQFQWGNAFMYNSPPVPGAPLISSSDLAGQSSGSFVALNSVREYQSVAGATWELDTSGRLRAALSRARADQEIATAQTSLSQRDLKRAVVGSEEARLRAGLRPPPKLHVRFSRMQLSRRLTGGEAPGKELTLPS
jgi:hypothetical protein